MIEISIWVGNLGKYNEGQRVGDWFTLPHDVDDIMKKIGVKSGTRYEEYEIFDWEAPEFVDINPYSSISQLNEIAENLQFLNDLQVKVLEVGLEEGIFNQDDLLYAIDQVITGEHSLYVIHSGYEDLEDFAVEYAVQSGDININNTSLVRAVDWDWYAKELNLHTTHFRIEKDTWVEFLK